MPYFPSSQNLPELLHNPSAIAALVSIGIHGLFALSLPTLSASSQQKEQNIKGTVKVVALTPTEQSRLPQPTSLPPLNTNIQPLPLPITPPLTSLPPVPLLPPPGNYSSNIPLIRLPPIYREDTPRTTSPLHRRQLTIQIPQEKRLPMRRRISDQFKIDEQPSSTIPPFTQPQVRETEAPRSENSEPKTEIQPENSSQPQVTTTTPEQQSTPEPTPVAQQPQPSPQVTQSPPQQQITRDEASTTDKDKLNNILAWVTKTRNPQDQNLEQSLVDFLTKWRKQEASTINLSPPYPKAACLNKLAGTAVMAVLVDSKGQLTEEPSLIESSGYPIFNQVALEAAKTSQFPNNIGKTQPYKVEVKFEYDSKLCSEAIPSPSPTQ
jgi:TonB family protein